MSYKYLVVSALQEELDEFMLKVSPSTEELELDVMLAKIQHRSKSVEILTFTADKMGMPFNAAKLMQIILSFRPKFIFFIGICAGIKDHPPGSVLIPKRVFSYESGKYENGVFSPDYTSYDTSDVLRKKAQSLNTANK
jgi:nucleoside phosphorylase